MKVVLPKETRLKTVPPTNWINLPGESPPAIGKPSVSKSQSQSLSGEKRTEI